MEAINAFTTIPNFSWTRGPHAKEFSEEKWKNAIDNLLSEFPKLANAPMFIDFVYLCPEFSLSCTQEEEADFTDPEYFYLDFGPMSDEYMFSEVEQGIHAFAVADIRFRPPKNENEYLDGIATYCFALRFNQNSFLGVLAKIDSPSNRATDWVPYTREFSNWLKQAILTKGRLLSIDSENSLRFIEHD